MKVVESKLFIFWVSFFIIVAGGIFYFNYGAPWNVFIKSNTFEAFLEDNYQKDFVIDEISYDIFHSAYHAYAYEKDKETVKFYVGEDIRTKEISDSYEYEKMRVKAQGELRKIVDKYIKKYKYANVEVVGVKEKEIEVNIGIYEDVDNEIKEKIKTEIQGKGYNCKQLFFNVFN